MLSLWGGVGWGGGISIEFEANGHDKHVGAKEDK